MSINLTISQQINEQNNDGLLLEKIKQLETKLSAYVNELDDNLSKSIIFKYSRNNINDFDNLNELVLYYNKYYYKRYKDLEGSDDLKVYIKINLSNNPNFSEKIIEIVEKIKVPINEIRLDNCNLTNLSKILNILENQKNLSKICLDNNNFQKFHENIPYNMKTNSLELSLKNCKLKDIPYIINKDGTSKILNVSSNPLNFIQDFYKLGMYNKIIYDTDLELLNLFVNQKSSILTSVSDESYQINFNVLSYTFSIQEFQKSNGNMELDKAIKGFQEFNEFLQKLQGLKENNSIDYIIKPKDDNLNSNIFDLSFKIKKTDQDLEISETIIKFLNFIIDKKKENNDNLIIRINIHKLEFEDFLIKNFESKIEGILENSSDRLDIVSFRRCGINEDTFKKLYNKIKNSSIKEIDFSENSIEINNNYFKLEEDDNEEINEQKILNLSNNKITNLNWINGNWKINLSHNLIKDFDILFLIDLNKRLNNPTSLNIDENSSVILIGNEILDKYNIQDKEIYISKIIDNLNVYLSDKIPKIKEIINKFSLKSPKNILIDFDLIQEDYRIQKININNNNVPMLFFQLDCLQHLEILSFNNCSFPNEIILNFPELSCLTIHNSQNLQKIIFKTHLQNFTQLDISNTPINEIASGRYISNLKEIKLNNIPKDFNFNFFTNLPYLEEIHITDSNLINIGFLKDLPQKNNLRILDLFKNSIKEVIDFTEFTNIKSLNINENPIESTIYLDTIPNENAEFNVPSNLIKEKNNNDTYKKYFTNKNVPESQSIFYLHENLFNNLFNKDKKYNKYEEEKWLCDNKSYSSIQSKIPNILKNNIKSIRTDNIYNLIEDMSKIIQEITLLIMKRNKYNLPHKINIIIDSFLPCQYNFISCGTNNADFNKDINILLLLYLINNLNKYNLEFSSYNRDPFTSLYFNIIGKYNLFTEQTNWLKFVDYFNKHSFKDCIIILESINRDINSNNQNNNPRMNDEIHLLIAICKFYNYYIRGSFEQIFNLISELKTKIERMADSIQHIIGLNLEKVKKLLDYFKDKSDSEYYPFLFYCMAYEFEGTFEIQSQSVPPFHDLFIYRMIEMIFQNILSKKGINLKEKFTLETLNRLKQDHKNFDENFKKVFKNQFNIDYNQNSIQNVEEDIKEPEKIIENIYNKIISVNQDNNFRLELRHDIVLCMCIEPDLFTDQRNINDFNIKTIFRFMKDRNESIYCHGMKCNDLLNRRKNFDKTKKTHENTLKLYYKFITNSSNNSEFDEIIDLFKIPKIELK